MKEVFDLFKNLNSTNSNLPVSPSENTFIPGAENLSSNLQDFVTEVNKEQAENLNSNLQDFVNKINTERGQEFFTKTLGIINHFQSNFKDLDIMAEWIKSRDKRVEAFKNVDESSIGYHSCSSLLNVFYNAIKIKEQKEIIVQHPQLAELPKNRELLGNWGNKSINEVLDQGIDNLKPAIEFLQTNSNLALKIGANIITPMLIYRSIGKIYTKNEAIKINALNKLPIAEKIYQLTVLENKKVVFLSIYAPLVTLIFYGIIQINSPHLLNVDINWVSDTANPSTSQSSSFFLLLINKFKKWPILTILAIVFILKCLGYSVEKWVLFFNSPIFLKWFFLIGSIIVFLLILENILSIILFYLFTKGKAKVPNLLPSFISNRLKLLENLSQTSDLSKKIFLDTQLKDLLFSVVVLSVSITMYIIYS
jgi:hypothetical protein